MRYAVLLVLLAAAPLVAQVQRRPADAPLLSAANESWYQQREPIAFAGNTYHRAGAAVFFDGNTMVAVGYFRGVPLYVDATVEPYSIVLVPVRRGLMQPYERLRSGNLAGTTASRTPSFPVRAIPEGFEPPQAPMAPTSLQQPIAATGSDTGFDREAVSTSGPPPVERREPIVQAPSRPMVSASRPESNEGLWIHYQGAKWISAGPAVPLRPEEFRAVGTYEGFPVFVRNNEPRVIYLPTRAGVVAPYKAR